MLTFDIVTLFPNLIEPHLKELPFKKALEMNLIDVNLHQLRDFSNNKHNTVDDKPYGGGTGMLLKIEPVHLALKKVYDAASLSLGARDNLKRKILVTMPGGTPYTQKKAQELEKYDQISIICGRYEGLDNRILDLDKILKKETELDVELEPISIGKYVLSGGELPALVIMESLTRLREGVLEKEDAAVIESYSESLEDSEFPQYTRPDNYNGFKVPEVLLSGDHKRIENWRKKNTAVRFQNPQDQ